MISPDAFDFTSTVSGGSMAPDADADTTRLRRSTGTASYVCAVWAFLQPAMAINVRIPAAAAFQKCVFTPVLPFFRRARSYRRGGESGGARAPQCHVRASPARWFGLAGAAP